MRIALVHKRYDRLGGAEWDCYELSRQLAARGHEVHVVVAESRVPVPEGVTLHRVPTLRLGKVAKRLSFSLAAPRVLRRVGAEVVVGFSRLAGADVFRISGGCHLRYLARKAAEGGRSEVWRQRLSPYEHLMLRLERELFAQPGPRLFLAVSELSRAEILASYPNVRADEVAVLHYGVDTEAFHPRHRATRGAELRAELGLAPDQPVVLFVGSGFQRKGVDTLLEIWEREPPAGAALLVVGKDQGLAAYRRRASGLAGPVILTGARNDVERFHAAADLFALPSLYEGCPVSILEALASGVPVVTSRATGAPELLRGPLDELLVDDPRDARAVAERLRLGLEPARRAELQAAARRAGTAVGLSETVDRLERILRDAAAARNATRQPVGT